jgi:hypothetical protein
VQPRPILDLIHAPRRIAIAEAAQKPQ